MHMPRPSAPHLMAPRRAAHSRQGGFSLLEVLVAILLLSFGLLGVAGLSASTFSFNKTAQLRLTGLALANDYADRARTNIYGFDRGGYTLAQSATPSANDAKLSVFTGKEDEPMLATAADLVATHDRNAFLQAVAARLPQGDAVVTSSPTTNGRDLNIWLLWKEPDSTGINTLAGNCPKTLTDTSFSCMYFKVGL
jgi:type IV pilus assembly protein PilV